MYLKERVISACHAPGPTRALPAGNTQGRLARGLHVFRQPVAVLPRWRFINQRSTTMNGLIKTAALAAMLASMTAFAQQTDPNAAAGQGGDFTALDTNGDGSVSQDEAKADATLSAKFAELDADKDGKISSSEYKKMSSGKEEKKY
jgi:hypothetical protein